MRPIFLSSELAKTGKTLHNVAQRGAPMANIELGNYISEIEQMLAAENNLEAVAHCRHILDYYPKNLAVYRLLGKGLLEQRQFADAANVLYRVLSATPDDFVAHLGLAIIGEEEGNLTQSVGHMARAFETQPNNGAIQEELKRLYGRRDGVAPSRIRLTRCALARLYLSGGNYAQAVEELQVALKEAPDRIDLQVLLAKALWHNEQRIDAVQVCQGILQHLPYSLEANAILYEIWQSTDREEEATLYRQRVEALDPFLAQELGDRPAGPHPKIEIPRLDYVPSASEEMMGVPDWVKDLGLHFDEQDEPGAVEAATGPFEPGTSEGPEVVPDWLRDMVPSGGEDGATEADHDWEAEKALEETIPTWLRDAGLLEDDEGEPVIEFDEPEDEAAEAPGGPPDEPLPSWLADAVEWEGKKKEELEPVEDVPADDWLLELDVEEPEPKSEEPATESGEPARPRDGGTGGFGELRWEQLEIGREGSTSEPPEDLTAPDEFPFDWQDWEPEEVDDATESIEPESESERAEESAMPQSNKDEYRTPGEEDDFGEMPSDPEEAIKWLERLAASQGAPLDELPSLQRGEEIAPGEELPDWLKEIAAASGHVPGSAEEETDSEDLGLPDWLTDDTLAARPAESSHPAASGAADDDVDLPDWLKEEFGEDEEEEPSAAAQQKETLPRADEAMAWLEELASSADEGAPEAFEEPEMPDWLKKELAPKEEREQPSLETAQDDEMPEDMDEAMAWLESLAARQGAPLDELTTYKADESPDVDLPDWLKAEYEAAEIEGEPADQPTEAEEELPAWLREASEEPIPAAEAEEPEIPDWLREAAIPAGEQEEEPVEPADEDLDLPDWLREEAVETVETEPEERAELPAWLRDEVLAEEPPAVEAEAVKEELELPAWLRDEAAEEVEAEEAEAAELPASDEEEIELPEWLSEEVWKESVDITKEEEIEPALVEEELELPEWLREEVDEEAVEAAEAELVADIEEEGLELPEWLQGEPPEEVVTEEIEEILEEEPELPAVDEEAIEAEIEAAEESLEAVAAEETVFVPAEEAEVAPAEEVETVPSEEMARAEVEAPEAEAVPEEELWEPEEEVEAPAGIIAIREQLAEAADDSATRLTLARALIDEEAFDEALSEYNELISASQALEQVIEDLDQILALQPRNTTARRMLGDAYMKQGDLAGALDAYRQALSAL